MDRKEHIKELLEQAAELNPAERELFLKRECGDDEDMKREVEELLTAGEKSPHLAASIAYRFGDEDITRGTILGDYVIGKKLGKGGMGQVYLAEHKDIPNIKVAIKIFEQGFAKEVEALSRVRSENIVTIITTGKLPDGRPFMVMEYLTGQTLADLLKTRGRLAHADIAEIMLKVGEASTELHETKTQLHDEGIIHRDLKPSNIMVENHKNRWKIKLFDLGVARLSHPLMSKSSSGHVAMGTPLYMAPEQFHGTSMADFGCESRTQKEIISPATDIYSLGVIAYEMLRGRHPFHDANSPAGVAMKQKENRYVADLNGREEIPVVARVAVLKAMAFCPAKRYQRAEEFGEHLASALAEVSLPNPETSRQPTTTNSTIAALVFFVVLIGGLVAWLSQRGSSAENDNQAVANSNRNSNQITNEGKSGIKKGPDGKRELREIAYWFVVQQTGKDNLKCERNMTLAPEGLTSGSWFKLCLSGNQHGYLYVINDGPSEKGSSIQVLFPIPQRNNGTSEIAPNRTVEAFHGRIDKDPGTDHLWVVWSADKVPNLERLSKYANDKDKGRLSEQNDIELTRSFLTRLKQADIVKDPQNQRTVLRGEDEILVKELLLSHL